MNGQRLYICYNDFDEDLASPELRDGVCNFIMEQLPATSKIQQWVLGSPQDPPPHGAVRGWVKIYKGWHQPPYEHFTLDLEWANAKGYARPAWGLDYLLILWLLAIWSGFWRPPMYTVMGWRLCGRNRGVPPNGNGDQARAFMREQ
jgi:hypothetical protein